MKKIMILGAGIYQVPLIETARKLGIYTIVVSIPGNYPGFPLADKVYYENTTDYDTILRIAKEEQIDGIVTAGTDVAVITIGRVCDELHLCGLSFEAAKIAADKLLMKQQYMENGVRTARYCRIPLDLSVDEISERIADLQYPLIFKCVDSSGSRGITRVDKQEQFKGALDAVRKVTRSDYFLVEEFLEGEEFGAQAFVYRGELKFIIPHGDYVFKGDTGVPIGHFAPYDLDPSIIEDAKQQLIGAIKAMKLDNCAINADFILKDGKTYVLELGGRSGATCLAELTSIYYGFDYYEKILRCSLGEDVTFDTTQKKTPNVSKLLMSSRDGIIKEQHNNNEANPNILDIHFDYQPGDAVHKFHVGPHRIGHVITKGETLEEAVEILNDALSKIDIIVE